MDGSGNPKGGAFWTDLQARVQEIGERNIKRRNSRAIASRQALTRPEVHEIYHRQLDQERSISNRIRFFEMEKEKQKRTLELARNKYDRVMEIRSQSRQEKKQCKNWIDKAKSKMNREAVKKATRVRQERKGLVTSLQKMREHHENEANSIRELSCQNEKSIRVSKKKEKLQNRSMVEKAHSEVSTSREVQFRRQGEQLQFAHEEHQIYLDEKMHFNSVKRRRNSVLRQKLNDSLQGHSQDRQKCMTELRQYTTLMREKGEHGGDHPSEKRGQTLEKEGQGIKKYASMETTTY